MTLRISAPQSDEAGGRRRGPDSEPVSEDYYLSRLVKLIPSEAIVAFPFLQSRAEDVIREVQDVDRRTAQAAAPAVDAAATIPDAAPAIPDAAADLSGAVPPDHWLLIAIAWLILIVVVLLRWQATRVENGPPQWGAVAIAAISFFLWVPVMDGTFGTFYVLHAYTGETLAEPIQKFIPELLLVLWTILVPAFYRPSG